MPEKGGRRGSCNTLTSSDLSHGPPFPAPSSFAASGSAACHVRERRYFKHVCFTLCHDTDITLRQSSRSRKPIKNPIASRESSS
eukprot:1188796-Prorocentrum_minimum.AAC.4